MNDEKGKGKELVVCNPSSGSHDGLSHVSVICKANAMDLASDEQLA